MMNLHIKFNYLNFQYIEPSKIYHWLEKQIIVHIIAAPLSLISSFHVTRRDQHKDSTKHVFEQHDANSISGKKKCNLAIPHSRQNFVYTGLGIGSRAHEDL